MEEERKTLSRIVKEKESQVNGKFANYIPRTYFASLLSSRTLPNVSLLENLVPSSF